MEEGANTPLIHEQNSITGISDRGPLRLTKALLFPIFLLTNSVVWFMGPFIKKYYRIDTSNLLIPSGMTESSPPLPISPLNIDVLPNGLRFGDSAIVEYTDSTHPLFTDAFPAFDDYLVGSKYITTAWDAIETFAYLGVAFMALALIVHLVFRQTPTTLAFKIGSTLQDNWKGTLPVWICGVTALVGIVRLFAITSFIETLAARGALYSIFLKSTPVSWKAFVDQVNDPSSRTYALLVMRSIGEWYEKGGSEWQFSTFSVVIGVTLNMCLVLAVFYLDTRLVRFRLSLDSERNPQIVSAMRAEIRRLPNYCRFWPIWFSMSSLGMSLLMTKIFGRVAFNSGRDLNRLYWTSTEPMTDRSLINDLISSYTTSVWLNPPQIVDVAVLLWIPISFAVILGSINRLDATSKLAELLSYGYWLRLFSIVTTTLPTPTTPLQLPYCYGEHEMGIRRMLKESEFCNDMIYSGHTAVTAIPCGILALMIVYGPFERKAVGLAGIVVTALLSILFVVVGRFHYTADVLLAVIISWLLVLVHAPAFKILFYYRRIQARVGTTAGISKSVGQLEFVNEALDNVIKSAKIDNDLTSWTSIELKQEKIRQFLQKLYDDL